MILLVHPSPPRPTPSRTGATVRPSSVPPHEVGGRGDGALRGGPMGATPSPVPGLETREEEK